MMRLFMIVAGMALGPVALGISASALAAPATAVDSGFVKPRDDARMRLFDEGWQFARLDQGAIALADLDTLPWRAVALPHDWSIEDLPAGEGRIGPFSRDSPGGISTGFTMGGVGVYRKTFALASADAGKRVSIYFDGVYMASDVWVNGHHLGFHPNGYTPFHYDLTSYLQTDGSANTMVVRVRNTGENSRWYAGSGIYRHVWLRVTEAVHIPVWGVFVKTPYVSAARATIQASVAVHNRSAKRARLQLHSRIIDPSGRTCVEHTQEIRVEARATTELVADLDVADPRRWSLEDPALYKLETQLVQDDIIVETERTTFGIRSIAFSTTDGFLLNGASVKLRGACLHHDNGLLGAAAYDRAEQRKLELLKANGFNAVRSSHNIPSQQFLDACDRLGLLVIDEAFDMWEEPKKPQDYHRYFGEHAVADIQRMVLRDRNHPSVIIWSYGNEIFERADPAGLAIAKRLIAAIKELDDTRPVTQAICAFWEHKHPQNRPWEDTSPAFALMDVHSYNYQWPVYESDSRQYPDRIIIGSETFAKEAFQNDSVAKAFPYVVGDFVWTGMDYLGEAGIGQAALDTVIMDYPWYNGFCGDLDLIGDKKPQSYYRDVVWGRSLLEVAVEQPAPEGHRWVTSKWGWRNELKSWNWVGHEGRPMDVYVYTPADSISVYVNGLRVCAQRAESNNRYIFHAKVPYQSGELRILAYRNGQEIARESLHTTGKPVDIVLQPDRKTIHANPNDLAFVTVSLVDDQGRLVTDADYEVDFEVEGSSAGLIAVGHANPVLMASFQSTRTFTYRGRCMAVLRPTGTAGTVWVRASVAGLPMASVAVVVGENTVQLGKR